MGVVGVLVLRVRISVPVASCNARANASQDLKLEGAAATAVTPVLAHTGYINHPVSSRCLGVGWRVGGMRL